MCLSGGDGGSSFFTGVDEYPHRASRIMMPLEHHGGGYIEDRWRHDVQEPEDPEPDRD
jgi:hypothetical protein